MKISAKARQPVHSEVHVSCDDIAAYVARVEDAQARSGDPNLAPPTFVLSIRRGFFPDVPLPPDSFAMYGGHDLIFHQPMRAGHTYHVQSQILDAYEKHGRSGRMWVIARQATVSDSAGQPVAELIERQIVRSRSNMEKQGKEQAALGSQGVEPVAHAILDESTPCVTQPNRVVEIGDMLGPLRRRSPDSEIVAGYADNNHVYENLFVSPAFARRLGYRNVIVPGPMQSAYLEQFLRQQLPDKILRSLSVTFRISVISGDPMFIRGVVTEIEEAPQGHTLTCDLMIENRDGERATVGQATLISRSLPE